MTHRVGEGDNAQEQSTQIELKEEDRLAAVVCCIDEEVAVVPRGAYLRTPLGEVVLNNSYQGQCDIMCVSVDLVYVSGLSLADSQRLNYYMHFRRHYVTDEPKVSYVCVI